MTMQSLNQLFRHNDEMPQESWEELRVGFIRFLKADLVARRLTPIRRLPLGTQTFSYDRIKTEGMGASIIGKGGIYPYDEYAIERISIDIVKIGRAYRIPMEDYEAGVVQNEQVVATRRFMQEREDSLILQGDSDYNILGLVDYAGNTNAAVAAWDQVGTTADEIYEDVRKTIRVLTEDNVRGPYTLVLAPVDNVDLAKIDVNEHRSAEELVQRLVARIMVSDGLPADTALVMQTGAEIAQLGMVEDLSLKRPRFDEDLDLWKGKARGREIPIVYQYGATPDKTDAIATLTAI